MNEKVAGAIPEGNSGRKQITVVFMDVVGYSKIAARLDAEDLQAWLVAFYERAEKIVEAHDGEVTEYLGDGIVALFGLSHADELAASKAVHASLATIDQINMDHHHGAPIKLRVGVATGEVVVSRPSRDRTMPRATGLVTTIAKRVQEAAAPGTVLISRTTQELLRGMIKTREVPDQKLKGFPEIQALFQVIGHRTDHNVQDPPVFVSREAEQIAIGKSKQPCLITGPAGIGKTALLQHCTGHPFAAVQINADGAQTHNIYMPFIRWIIQQLNSTLPQYSLIQLHFGKLTENAKQAIALVLGLPEGQQLLAELSNIALKSLIEKSIWEAIQTKQVDGIIIFEDLHWLDRASFGVLAHILSSEAAQRYQILLSSRDDPKIAKYLSKFALTKVPLGPLSDSDATAMLVALKDKKVPEINHRDLVARAAGVPLFIKHLSQRAAQTGGSLNDLPDTLTDLLAEQVDATGPAKQMLRCAAIIGRTFDRDMLAVLSDSPETIDQHLRQASNDSVIRQEGPNTWSFAHSLLWQVTYEGMLRQTRTAYHSQFAAHLQSKRLDHVIQNPWILAEHLRLSEQYVPAIKNYLRASQLALLSGALEDAEAHVLAAIGLCEDAPEDVDLRILEIACQTALGSTRMQTLGFTAKPVKEAFDRVIALARANNQYGAAHGPAFCGSFTNAILSADKMRATQFSTLMHEAAHAVAPQQADHVLRVVSSNLNASLHFYCGDFLQTFECADQVRETYDIAKHRAMIVDYGIDSFAATQMYEAAGRAVYGDTHLADALCAETDRHQDLLNIPVMQPYAQIWGAVPLFYAGQKDRAVARVLHGLALAEKQSAAFWQVTGAAWLHVMDPSQSDSINGLKEFGHVLTTHENIGALVGLPYFRAHYALALAKHGHLDEAYKTSLRAVRENTDNGLLCWYAEVLRIHARICHDTNRPADAACFLKHAVATASVQNARLWLLRARLDQAKLGLITGKDLAAAIDTFDPRANPPEISAAKDGLVTA